MTQLVNCKSKNQMKQIQQLLNKKYFAKKKYIYFTDRIKNCLNIGVEDSRMRVGEHIRGLRE